MFHSWRRRRREGEQEAWICGHTDVLVGCFLCGLTGPRSRGVPGAAAPMRSAARVSVASVPRTLPARRTPRQPPGYPVTAGVPGGQPGAPQPWTPGPGPREGTGAPARAALTSAGRLGADAAIGLCGRADSAKPRGSIRESERPPPGPRHLPPRPGPAPAQRGTPHSLGASAGASAPHGHLDPANGMERSKQPPGGGWRKSRPHPMCTPQDARSSRSLAQPCYPWARCTLGIVVSSAARVGPVEAQSWAFIFFFYFFIF